MSENPGRTIDASYFSADVQELIRLLSEHDVRYVVVGGEAVIYYGLARLTGDIDFFFDRDPENADRLFRALEDFWDGNVPGLDGSEELTREGLILQYGVPPNRIDLINAVAGISFQEAWNERTEVQMVGSDLRVPVYYVGLQALIKNKEAIGRPKDLTDLAFLRKAAAKG